MLSSKTKQISLKIKEMNYLKYLNISPLPMNPNAMLFHTRDDPFF